MALKVKRARIKNHCIEEFKQSASNFAMYEEEALNMDIQETNDISEIFHGYTDVQIDPDLEHL